MCQPGPKKELNNVPHVMQNWKERLDKHKQQKIPRVNWKSRPMPMKMLAGGGVLLPLVWNGVAVTLGSERSCTLTAR
jgi:hypothetical protein